MVRGFFLAVAFIFAVCGFAFRLQSLLSQIAIVLGRAGRAGCSSCTADAACWIKAGPNASDPAVVGADTYLQSGGVFHYTCKTGKDYIAVITDSLTLANGLKICRVR